MITRVHKGGGTFAGLARYLTRGGRHDAIETENLSSRDARTSARIMQATANDSKLLKRLAGRSARGRPLRKPAHHFTGSWAPDEAPSDEEMFTFGRRCLKALRFDDRQSIMVIHRDKTYRGQTRHELHVMTNRVSAETGMAAPDDDDAIRLSAVAKLHEQEQGRIYVRSRFERRPSAERERKRMRRPDGTTTPMTAFERGQFAAKKREHREQRTPKAQREAELTRIGRDLRKLRSLRERADRLEGLAVVVPVSVELPPRSERPRVDLDQVRIENPAPAAALPLVELPPRSERPRVDLDQVRIENPAPAAALPLVELPPRSERPRVDLDQVRIENPAPAAALPLVELPPRSERPRVDLDQVRIENPAPAAALPLVELPPRPEDKRQPDDERQRAAAVRDAFNLAAADTAAATRKAASDLVTSLPAGVPLDQVETDLFRHHDAPDDNRYTERLDVGHGVGLQVGPLRMGLETDIIEHAKKTPHRRGRSRVPPARPDTLLDAIIAAVTAIQKAADRIVNPILDRVLDRDPAPTLTGAAPMNDQLSAQGGEKEAVGQPPQDVGAPPDHDTGRAAPRPRPPDMVPGGVRVDPKADEAPEIDRGDGYGAGGVDEKATPRTPGQDLSPGG